MAALSKLWTVATTADANRLLRSSMTSAVCIMEVPASFYFSISEILNTDQQYMHMFFFFFLISLLGAWWKLLDISPPVNHLDMQVTLAMPVKVDLQLSPLLTQHTKHKYQAFVRSHVIIHHRQELPRFTLECQEAGPTRLFNAVCLELCNRHPPTQCKPALVRKGANTSCQLCLEGQTLQHALNHCSTAVGDTHEMYPEIAQHLLLLELAAVTV